MIQDKPKLSIYIKCCCLFMIVLEDWSDNDHMQCDKMLVAHCLTFLLDAS